MGGSRQQVKVVPGLVLGVCRIGMWWELQGVQGWGTAGLGAINDVRGGGGGWEMCKEQEMGLLSFGQRIKGCGPSLSCRLERPKGL